MWSVIASSLIIIHLKIKINNKLGQSMYIVKKKDKLDT